MDPQTMTSTLDVPTETANNIPNDQPVDAPTVAANKPEPIKKAKVMFEQVELFELEPDEARDTEYLRKLLEPHYPAATDAKFEYKQQGDCLIVTMIKQNPPKG